MKKILSAILLLTVLLTFVPVVPAQATDYSTEQILNQIRTIPGTAKRAYGIQSTCTDGTNAVILRTDATGHPQCDILTMPSITVTGVATQATLAAISAQLPASLGIKAAANSLSVVLASDGVLPLPTGAATSALQTSGNASLTSIDGKTPSKGSAAMAASSPVTIATDDTLLTALDTALDIVAGDTTSMDGKMPAKGSAAMAASTPITVATDDTMIQALDTAVDAISTKTPALGSAAMAASSPVTLATDDTVLTATNGYLATIAGFTCNTGAVTIAGSALPTGAATSALQTNGNASLTSIDGKLAACNTGAIAGSVTANAGTNLNTSLLATEATLAAANASLSTIAAFTCNTGAVTVSSMPSVTLNALPSGTNNIGSIGSYGGGNILVNTSGASNTDLLAAATGTKKHRIYKLYIVTGASETITLSDGAGAFKSDANGVFSFDFNPVGSIQGTADTAITLTTGSASAWTATVIYKDE